MNAIFDLEIILKNLLWKIKKKIWFIWQPVGLQVLYVIDKLHVNWCYLLFDLFFFFLHNFNIRKHEI